MNRRRVLVSTAVLAGGAAARSAEPNDTVRMAVVGCGAGEATWAGGRRSPMLHGNPNTMTCIGDPEANAMLTRARCAPLVVPNFV